MIGDKLCGHDIPDPMKSTGNSITLVFKSGDMFSGLETEEYGFSLITTLGKSFCQWL